MTKILDVAAYPQLAEILSYVEAGDDVILIRDGHKVAEVKSAEERLNSGGWVFGLGANTITYVSDDFDAELPESFWMGEE